MSKNKHQNNQAQISRQQMREEIVGIIHHEFSGPLPPPQVLAKYNEIIPNGAERIMTMAEAQNKSVSSCSKRLQAIRSLQ